MAFSRCCVYSRGFPLQLMILQIQFVSLLRLLEANITEPFMDFLDSIKWLNLHFEVDVRFLKCNDEVTRGWVVSARDGV